MTDASEWRSRVGEAWAEEWRRTDRAIAPIGEALVAKVEELLADVARPKVLDVGCGAGATSLALADRLAAPEIVGIDLSAPLVAVATARAAVHPALRFEVADAATWNSGGRFFDAIVSRHGVMFFDDPIGAFTHLRALCAPGARLVFSCFRARTENDWVMALAPILLRFSPETAFAAPQAVGPFAFADPDLIRNILTAAGFAAPRIETFDFDFVAGAGEGAAAVDDAVGFFGRIGPFAALLRGLDSESRAAALDQVGKVTEAHLTDGEVLFKGAAWIVSSEAS